MAIGKQLATLHMPGDSVTVHKQQSRKSSRSAMGLCCHHGNVVTTARSNSAPRLTPRTPAVVSAATVGYSRYHKSVQRRILKEAEMLKQQIRSTFPDSVFRFRLRSMKRRVVPPADSPLALAHRGSAPVVIVGGHGVAWTRPTWGQQKDRLLQRLPPRIDETRCFVG